jgi:calcineurin-like phosphoesterase family protein
LFYDIQALLEGEFVDIIGNHRRGHRSKKFSAVVVQIEETNYQNEKFALMHPGGAVGERLNSRSPR